MSSSNQWEESLNSLQETIKCMQTLEQEDIVYLQEFILKGSLEDDSELECLSNFNSVASNVQSQDQITKHDVKLNGFSDAERSISVHHFIEDLPNEFYDKDVDDPDEVSIDISDQSIQICGELPVLNDKPCDLSISKPLERNTTITKDEVTSPEVLSLSKDKSYECKECQMKLSSKKSLRRHVLVKHIQEKNHVCLSCNKSFVFKFSLKTHMLIHLKTPQYVCVCGKKFGPKASYMDHIRRIHQAVPSSLFTCEICNKTYQDRSTLRKHLSAVHKSKTIQCTFEGCKKVFSTVALMKSHHVYHEKHQYTCDECQKSFSTKQYMFKHKLTHSGIRCYMCIECGKSYLSVSHLNQHFRRAHSVEKPFQCSFCGKCFKIKDYLISHENEHKGIKPHKCFVCDYATAFSSHLIYHKKTHVKVKKKNNKKQTSNKKAKNSNLKPRTAFRKIKPLIHDKDKIEDEVPTSSGETKSKSGIKTVKISSVTESYKPINNFLENVFDQGKELKLGNVSIFKAPLQSTNLVNGNKYINRSNIHDKVHDVYQDTKIESPLINKGISALTTKSNTNNKLKTTDESQTLNSTREIKEVNSSPNCVIFANNGQCALSNCQTKEETLVLIELGDNKFVAVCAQHISEGIQQETLTINNKEKLSKSNPIAISPITVQEDDDKDNFNAQRLLSFNHDIKSTNENLKHLINYSNDATLQELNNSHSSGHENEQYKCTDSESVVIYSAEDFTSLVDFDGSESCLPTPIDLPFDLPFEPDSLL